MLRTAIAHTCSPPVLLPIPSPASSSFLARLISKSTIRTPASRVSSSSPSRPFSSSSSSRRNLATTTTTMASALFSRSPPSLPLPPLSFDGKFKIALCQLAVTSDKDNNIAHAQEKIESAAENGAKLIVLPEMWNCPYTNASFPVYAEDISAGADASPSTKMLSEVAKRKRVTIIGGSIPERHANSLYNTCCVYGSDGELKAKHRKVHLFDIDIPGKMTFKESDTLTPGEGITVVDTDVGRIGIGICYDIRFQELAMLYAARGAHMICYPGAFNMTTGPLHWELLARARAVDNQMYVITCSPARDSNAGYVAWGHSTVVGPFGEIVSTTDHEEATVFADIDYSQIDQRRTNIPLGMQRRGDLYCLVDVTRNE